MHNNSGVFLGALTHMVALATFTVGFVLYTHPHCTMLSFHLLPTNIPEHLSPGLRLPRYELQCLLYIKFSAVIET